MAGVLVGMISGVGGVTSGRSQEVSNKVSVKAIISIVFLIFIFTFQSEALMMFRL